MAIQLPDPGNGVPEDETGDNEHVMWLKTRANFSDQNNAASRLVGTGTGQIPLAENILAAALGSSPEVFSSTAPASDLDSLQGGDIRTVWRTSAINSPPQLTNNYITVMTIKIGAISNGNSRFQFAWGQNVAGFVWRTSTYTGAWQPWSEPRTDKNTTKDANGFIKAASPIVKVFADKVELNDDAASQDVTFVKNGVGDYTINTVSGLSTDGWYIELPKDINGNPKVAVTLNETDGVISLKCYKRIFSMETFTFVPDLDEPMDVPDGRWIDLRLNEIAADEPIEPLE
ncbi:hypothetical protein SAMN05660405_02574 [Psychrobacter pacificensis]|uniref:Phage tail protein C-terminal domain-containing protein n=1 Tax=Psychrobacter pacificensis TaxID=112002 RepID=A0A1G7ATU0_9GAMM|nr:hypothetical protein [Psychrobacter pacificensis]GLR29011.1 hypothetical protein GCM10007915_12490 [Psychrobacter pacificensis]SDE17356.1 hypothetical protein SAMN05660405_02574 [Psychrobacter pacificensis]